MFKDYPTLRTEVSGTEHTPDYATENAQAFVELGKAVADTFGADYDELRITDNNHYFIVEEDGELNNYTIAADSSDIDYSDIDPTDERERQWQKSMTLSEFESALESITESDAALHGVSRATEYRRESSTGPGMMEGFGGPREVPVDYGDAIMPLATEDNNIKVLLKGAPNSGAKINNSILDIGATKIKSLLSDKDSHEIMIEENQSDQEPYAQLNFIEGSEYEDGMGEVSEDKLDEVIENTSRFEVELE